MDKERIERRFHVWNAVFAASFVAQVEALYQASWQASEKGPAGMSRSDIAEPDSLGLACAETAAQVASAAVASLEQWERESE